MSCHGTAEFPVASSKRPVEAPLVPVDPAGKFYTPGSPQWDQWFQDRSGTVAQSGSSHVALDYDMVSRQALLNWDAAGGSATALERARLHLKMLRDRGKR